MEIFNSLIMVVFTPLLNICQTSHNKRDELTICKLYLSEFYPQQTKTWHLVDDQLNVD